MKYINYILDPYIFTEDDILDRIQVDYDVESFSIFNNFLFYLNKNTIYKINLATKKREISFRFNKEIVSFDLNSENEVYCLLKNTNFISKLNLFSGFTEKVIFIPVSDKLITPTPFSEKSGLNIYKEYYFLSDENDNIFKFNEKQNLFLIKSISSIKSEIAVANDFIFKTTGTDKIFIYDANTGDFFGIIQLFFNVEAIFVFKNLLFASEKKVIYCFDLNSIPLKPIIELNKKEKNFLINYTTHLNNTIISRNITNFLTEIDLKKCSFSVNGAYEVVNTNHLLKTYFPECMFNNSNFSKLKLEGNSSLTINFNELLELEAIELYLDSLESDTKIFFFTDNEFQEEKIIYPNSVQKYIFSVFYNNFKYSKICNTIKFTVNKPVLISNLKIYKKINNIETKLYSDNSIIEYKDFISKKPLIKNFDFSHGYKFWTISGKGKASFLYDKKYMNLSVDENEKILLISDPCIINHDKRYVFKISSVINKDEYRQGKFLIACYDFEDIFLGYSKEMFFATNIEYEQSKEISFLPNTHYVKLIGELDGRYGKNEMNINYMKLDYLYNNNNNINNEIIVKFIYEII